MSARTGKRVVVTDHAFKDVSAEAAMAHEHGASFLAFSCRDVAETASAVEDADVAIVNFAPMTRDVLTRMKPGATVVRYGIGYDNVDVDAARDLHLQVANVPDYGVDTVADHAVSSLLMLARRIPHYDQRIKRDRWVRPADIGPIRGFRSLVVGLVGMGRIARAVHQRLAPFGCSFVGFDPYCPDEVFAELGVRRVDLASLAGQAHAITLHAPNNRETRHLVDTDFLAALQPGSILVNTARGSLVDEAGLADALNRGQLAGAALDVFDSEPLAQDSPLRSANGAVLTPHAAFYDEDSLRALQRLASEEAGRALRGEPLRCSVL